MSSSIICNCPNKINKYFDEIIIRPRRQQKNKHKFLLKNRVRYKRAYNSGGGKVVSGMGYIVKITKIKSQLSSMAISFSHHHHHQLKWTTYMLVPKRANYQYRYGAAQYRYWYPYSNSLVFSFLLQYFQNTIEFTSLGSE